MYEMGICTDYNFIPNNFTSSDAILHYIDQNIKEKKSNLLKFPSVYNKSIEHPLNSNEFSLVVLPQKAHIFLSFYETSKIYDHFTDNFSFDEVKDILSKLNIPDSRSETIKIENQKKTFHKFQTPKKLQKSKPNFIQNTLDSKPKN